MPCEIVRLYKEGLHATGVAYVTGVSWHKVVMTLAQHDVPLRNKLTAQRQLWENMKRLYEEGLSLAAISRKLNVTPPSIRYARKQNWVPRPYAYIKDKSKLLQLIKAGLSVPEIMKQTGLCDKTVMIHKERYEHGSADF